MKPWEKAALQTENKKPWETAATQQEKRGVNLGGAARNVAQGLTLNFADEIEAKTRATDEYYKKNPRASLSEVMSPAAQAEIQENYNKYLKNARESAEGFAKEKPNTALALQIGGALLPTVASFGATAPASGASLGARIAAGAKTGAGLGAISGFGAGEGGAGRRSEGAALGALFGGGIGAAFPAATAGVSAIGRGVRRTISGMGDNPIAASKIRQGLSELVSGANPRYKSNTELLSLASRKGDEAISGEADAIERILQLSKKAEKKGYGPNVVEGAEEVLQPLKTPRMEAAEKALSEFRAAADESTGMGLVLNNWAKQNPTAAKLVEKALKVDPNFFEGMNPSSYSSLNKINNLVQSQIAKTTDATTEAVLKKAKSSLGDFIEEAVPGNKAINAEYAAAKNEQELANEAFAKNISKIAKPTEPGQPRASAKDVTEIGFRPYIRGKARELLEQGALKRDYGGSIDKIFQSLGLGGYSALTQGVK